MKQRIKELIKTFKEIENELNKEGMRIFISDNTLFSEAVSTYRGEQAGKNRFKTEYKQTKPASQKQIDFIHGHTINIDTKDLTSLEASKIIKKWIEEHPKKNE